MIAYHFMCKKCNESCEEVFSRKQSNFASMCQTAIANLMYINNGKIYFSKEKDVIPFLEENWEALTTQPKKTFAALNPSIHKTLISNDIFKHHIVGDDVIVCLKNTNLYQMKPGYHQFRILARQLKTKVTTGGGILPQSGGWHANNRKRKATNNNATITTGASTPSATRVGEMVTNTGKPKRGIEETKVKLTQFNYPVDHPFNKDSYRYIYVESDPHAKGRQLWEECEATAGRIIPGFFYRVTISQQIALATNDRAHQLKLSDSQLSVTGDKGYCMIRATQPVSRGCWYFEAKIVEQPDNSHARIGWSQSLGNLQAPCGFDKFSYACRSRFGTAFNQSKGKHYMNHGYKKGDVLGCMLIASAPNTKRVSKQNLTQALFGKLPESFKERPLIKFKNSYYYEEKEEASEAEKELKQLENSKITFYKNGVSYGPAFTDIFDGAYYPAISIYKQASVAVNFGPNFTFPPTDVENWIPMSERHIDLEVEQTVSDMLWLTEKDDTIEQIIMNPQ
uniref:ASH2 n=1 Tax=Schmidtea mediterranea TaxID=79327 RepID=A0A0X9ERK4_SCHMD|nr:ASH2 [Schmidtea mediterranea]